MTKATALSAFAQAIERETHIKLSSDALHRVILHLCSNVLEPEHVKSITLIGEVARAILLKNVAVTAPAGSSFHLAQTHLRKRAEADIEAAAATILREMANRRLISQAYSELTAEWKDEAGTPVLPPTALEWVELRKEFIAFRDDARAKIEAYEAEAKQDSELIITTQTVACSDCAGTGAHWTDEPMTQDNKCAVCGGTGARSIEVARNRPVPTPEPEVAAGRAWERVVMDTGFNPGSQRAAYVAGYVAGVRSTEE